MPAPQRTIWFISDASCAAEAARQMTELLGRFGMSWKVQLGPWSAVAQAQPPVARLIHFLPEPAAELPPEHIPREHWPIEPQDAHALKFETEDLVARLMSGLPRPVGPRLKPASPVSTAVPAKPARAAPLPTLKLHRETKGRRGKGVTLISEFPTSMPLEQLEALATRLKSRCGTGGTLKDRVIEIQGDQRDRIQAELEALGYRVKRAGA